MDVALQLGDHRAIADYPQHHFDAVVTVPPRIAVGVDVIDMMQSWLAGRDSIPTGPIAWRAVARVLKPGAGLAVIAEPPADLLTIALRFAGLEVRDTIHWTHGDGHESVIIARKPIGERTVKDNVLRHGTGAMNIDACRIEYISEADQEQARVPQPKFGSDTGMIYQMQAGEGRNGDTFDPSKGRWPANWILSHSQGCLDVAPGTWKCSETCPVRALDIQSGHSAGSTRVDQTAGSIGGAGIYRGGAARGFFHYADAGTASRFFLNLEGGPRVPVQLLGYLARLLVPPGGTILDPFIGTGGTALACIKEGIGCVGFCQDQGSLESARIRLKEVGDGAAHAERVHGQE